MLIKNFTFSSTCTCTTAECLLVKEKLYLKYKDCFEDRVTVFIEKLSVTLFKKEKKQMGRTALLHQFYLVERLFCTSVQDRLPFPQTCYCLLFSHNLSCNFYTASSDPYLSLTLDYFPFIRIPHFECFFVIPSNAKH